MDQRHQQVHYPQSSSAVPHAWPVSPSTSALPLKPQHYVQMDSESSRMIGGTVGPSQYHQYPYPTPQAYDHSYASSMPLHSAPNSIPYQSYNAYPQHHQHPQPTRAQVYQPVPSSQVSPFQQHQISQRSSGSSSEIVSPSSALSEPSVQTPLSSDAYLGFGFNASSSTSSSTAAANQNQHGAPLSISIPPSQAHHHPTVSAPAPPSAPGGYLNSAPARPAPKGNANLVVSLPPSNPHFTQQSTSNPIYPAPNPNPNNDFQDASSLPPDPPPLLQDQFTGKTIQTDEDLMEYRRMLEQAQQASQQTAAGGQYGGVAYSANGSGSNVPPPSHENGHGNASSDFGGAGAGVHSRSRRGSGGSSQRGSGSGEWALRLSSFPVRFISRAYISADSIPKRRIYPIR